ncbi:MAG: helix-turn-helix domain-containing protein [Phycisphaerae bacterium]
MTTNATQSAARPSRMLIAGSMDTHNGLIRDLWQYATRHLTYRNGGLMVNLGVGPTAAKQIRRWGARGILAHISNEKLLNAIKGTHLPVVNTSGIIEEMPFPSVLPDNHAIGVLAGEHLREKNYRHFAFVGCCGMAYVRDRLAGFRQAVKSTGQEVQIWDGKPPGLEQILDVEHGKGELSEFAEWVRQLPEHTGVMTSDDDEGFLFCELARVMQIDVGRRFGIVAGHDRQAATMPSLTSVIIPEMRWAQEAISLLVDIILGRREAQPGPVIRLEPLGIAQRESTLGVACDDPHLRAAVLYIHDHSDEPIYVEDVVAATGIGRRALERRFREHMGHTVLHEIHLAHIEQAKRLLVETDLTIDRVAAASGLSDADHLIRLFSKVVGTTPGQWRSDHQAKLTGTLGVD